MSPDRVSETLTALRTDVDRVGLADSASIRHRGRQRTRNQAIGGTLAVLLLVSAGVGIAGGLTGDDRAVNGPPAGPTVTTSQDPERTYALAADPFLRESDLAAIGLGPYDNFTRSPEWAADQAVSLPCLIDPGAVGAVEARPMLFYSDLDATIRQHVLRFEDTESARSAVGKLAAGLTGCDMGAPGVTVTDRGPEAVAVGDEGFRFSRFAVPQVAAGTSYAEIALIRAGNVVLVLDWSSMGNPYDDPEGSWAWTPERGETALDRAVAR